MTSEKNNSLFAFIGGLAIGILLLYVGGWSIAWNDFIATKKSLYIGHGIAIEFNHRYYGFIFKSRFFDSAVISWIMGLISISTLYAGFKALFAEHEDDEQPNKSTE